MAKKETSEYKEGLSAKKKQVATDKNLEVKQTPTKKQVAAPSVEPKKEVKKASANFDDSLASKLNTTKATGQTTPTKSSKTTKGKPIEMKDIPEKNISALRSIAPSPRATRTFRVYQGSTMLAEGSSPISLANKLTPNTTYSNLKIAAVEDGLQSVLVGVPSFKTLEHIVSVTGLTITPIKANTTAKGTAQYSYKIQPADATNQKLKSVTASVPDAARITVDENNKKINVQMLGKIQPNLLDPTTQFPISVTGETVLPTSSLVENYEAGVTYYITLCIKPGDGFTPEDLRKARIRIGDAGNIEINANFKNLGNNLFQTGFKYNTTPGVTNKLTIRQPKKADGTYNKFVLEDVIVKRETNTDIDDTITITATTEDGGKTAQATTTVVYGEDMSIPVTGITLPQTNYQGKVGTTLPAIVPSIQPANATVTTYTVKSGDATKVEVQSDNSLKLLAKVTDCPVTFTTTDGGFTATAKVTVTEETQEVKPTSIRVSPSSISFPKGSSGISVVKLTPDNTTNKNIEIGEITGTGFTAKYEQGQVIVSGTTPGKGSVKIMSSANKDLTATLNVECLDVNTVPVTKMTPSPSTVNINIDPNSADCSQYVYVSVEPDNATNKSFKVDTNEVSAMQLKVDDGVGFTVNPIHATTTQGGATVTITSVDNPDIKARVKVTIIDDSVPDIIGISFEKEPLTVKVGKEVQTAVTLLPIEGSSHYQIKNVTSNKSDVATPRFLPSSTIIVAEGHSVGEATFTVEAWNPNVPKNVVKKELKVIVTN